MSKKKEFNIWKFLARAADPKSNEYKILKKVNEEWDKKKCV